LILLNVKYKTVSQFEKNDFRPFIIDWITDTRDLRYHMEIDKKEGDYLVYEYQKKKLCFVDYSEAGVLVAYHSGTDRKGVEWRLSVVFHYVSHELFVQLNNSETTESGRFLRKFRKPDLIDELVDLGVIRKDGCIDISYSSHDIYLDNIDQVKKIIEGSMGNILPIIFLSTTPYGYYAVDPERLADIYAGLAHIFAQRNEEVTYILKDEYQMNIPYGGSIAIYFPIKSLQPNLTAFGRYDERQILNRISKALAFYFKSQNYGRMTTYDEISSIVLSGRNKSLKSQNEQIIEENQKIVDENRSIVETFDIDLKKTGEENDHLKKRNADLEKENQILRQRLEQAENVPLLFYGSEEDLYPGEIKELLIDMLAGLNLKPGSRRADIISDLLKSNKIESTLKQRHEEVKDIFIHHKGLDRDQINRLEKLGFTVTSDGKHNKLVYYKNSYATVFSKTASDFRSGKNAAALIIQKMM